MALPFLAGIAVGSLAVVAWNRRDKIKDYASCGLEKGKETAEKIYEKGKTVTKDVKEFVVSSKDQKKGRGAKKTQEETQKTVKKTRKPRSKKAPAPVTLAPELA
ncbi:MAG: hypothetical protein LUC34_08165 [Campylobacter sp.]|nr:hypothetical protein [Campylobacter sp.]